MTNKKFQIIGDGIVLQFFKAFDEQNKGLKKKLWHWYLKCFQFTRCEFDKRLDVFSVYYKDGKTENLRKKLLQYRSSEEGQGIDLNIYIAGDIVQEPLKTFVGNEFIVQYDGITEFVYKDFFQTEVKTITQAFADTSKVKGIAEYGRISTKYQIESILAEYENPCKTGLPKEVLLK